MHKLFENYEFLIKNDEKRKKSEKSFPEEDLKRIILKTGGRVREVLSEGIFILICDDEENSNPIRKKNSQKLELVISHKWVLDSISHAKILDCNDYRV